MRDRGIESFWGDLPLGLLAFQGVGQGELEKRELKKGILTMWAVKLTDFVSWVQNARGLD